jgi:hypothetical protein
VSVARAILLIVILYGSVGAGLVPARAPATDRPGLPRLARPDLRRCQPCAGPLKRRRTLARRRSFQIANAAIDQGSAAAAA